MRIPISPRENWKEYWEPWFAWYPVTVEMADGTFCWMFCEMVERRESAGYKGAEWRYREYLGVKK